MKRKVEIHFQGVQDKVSQDTVLPLDQEISKLIH
jgi:hypothetical protein